MYLLYTSQPSSVTLLNKYSNEKKKKNEIVVYVYTLSNGSLSCPLGLQDYSRSWSTSIFIVIWIRIIKLDPTGLKTTPPSPPTPTVKLPYINLSRSKKGYVTKGTFPLLYIKNGEKGIRTHEGELKWSC